MNIYKYLAVDRRGNHVRGTLDALSERDVFKLIECKGLLIQEVIFTGKRRPAAERAREFWENTFRIGEQHILIFTRELSLMLKVGIPVDRAFHTIAGYQEDHRLSRVVIGLREDIMSGHSMSGAISHHPRVFPPIFKALIEVGEKTGEMARILEELADYQERELHTKKKVQSALFYPLFVMGCTVIILGVLMTYFVPSFVRFYEGMQIKLPLATQVLMFIVHVFQNPVNLSLIALVIILLVFFYHSFAKTLMGRLAIDKFKLRLPVLGDLFLLIGMARFARTFGLMYNSGITVDRIMKTSQDVVQNELLREVFEQCENEIREGETLSRSFGTKKPIPVLMSSFMMIGEETESLAYAMEKIAAFYDDQVSYKVECIVSMLEPMFMSVVAFIVGFVVLSLFLPIYTLVANFGS